MVIIGGCRTGLRALEMIGSENPASYVDGQDKALRTKSGGGLQQGSVWAVAVLGLWSGQSK